MTKTWSDPMSATPTTVEAYALAGGRLFATYLSEIYASTGIGVV